MNSLSFKSTLLTVLTLILFSCGQNEKPAAAEEAAADPGYDFTIVPGERVGLITPDQSSREEVLALYGDSARVDSVYLVEGQYGEGVVLFPDNPRRRVEIYWDPEINADTPAFISINGLGPADGGTEWKTVDGITVGTAISEVERLNGTAFDLSGFGWDYGGQVTNWNGGQFNNNLHLSFHLMTEKDVPMEVQGERTLKSNDPAVTSLNPVVAVMKFDFRKEQ